MDAPDIKDIRPPVELPLYVWILLGVAVCIIAFLIFLYVRRHFKKAAPAPVIVPVGKSWEIALQLLVELKDKQLPQKGMYKEFYSILSDIIRHYLEARFNIKAPEMTTEEFLNFVNSSASLNNQHGKVLKDFLNGCDMVKFAKHVPSPFDAQMNFDLAKRLIMETIPADGI